jgi:hypothetical protein
VAQLDGAVPATYTHRLVSAPLPVRRRGNPSWLLLSSVTVAAALVASCDGDEPLTNEEREAACEAKPSRAFHERIEPLLSEERATTCNQCHLSGVDLSAFARETPCKTWACLVDQGLVDIASPEQSKILGWILRASPDSELITDSVIRAEHDGFLEWIQANVQCPDACRGVTCGEPADGPTCDEGTTDTPQLPQGDDERGCSDEDLEQAFFDDVYAWRGRCYPCHFDTERDGAEDAPRWLSLVGNCQTGSAVSLKRVLTLGIIDVSEPEQSLLLQKPLGPSGGGVEHGGGTKFTTADETYLSFSRFVRHYAECRPPK